MFKQNFLTWLDESNEPRIADGAMGTELHTHGVSFDACFDALNLNQPAVVAEIHRAYIDAGAQIILTNTFGANAYKLAEHGLEAQVAEINRAGAELARRVVMGSFKDIWVGGDVGPLGVRLAPYGRVHKDEARQAFEEQIAALAAGGVDFIIIETISDLNEALQAVKAARAVCDLPVVATMTFTRDDRTILGDDPVMVAQRLHKAGADVIGVNCSGGPVQLLRLLQIMRQAVLEARFWIKPNAGWPEQVAGRIMYPATPEYFGDYTWSFFQAGACVIGGCCGTTPAHIEAMHGAVTAGKPISMPQVDVINLPNGVGVDAPPDRTSPLCHKLAEGKFVFAVEMDPPKGLSTHKLLAGARMLMEAGADVINVADSPMARMRMSPWAVCSLLQDKVKADTTLHFPTRGRSLLRVQGDLLAAHALGIRNVFVVMGDPTAIGDYPEAMDNYDLVPSGLVKLIKQGFNAGVDHAGADIGQPTAFFVGGALNLTPNDPVREIKVLRRKVRAGVDFLLTQPVYDASQAGNLLDAYATKYGSLNVPVLVGILPLYNTRHARFLHNEVPGINIPDNMFARLENAESSQQEGVRIAIELIDALKDLVQGVYLMPAFNRYDLAAEIVEAF